MTLLNLHAHDMFSFLDGMSTPEQVALRCKELGMTHCCQSNHQNVAGHLAHYKACKDNGLIPVLGCEIYHKDGTYDYLNVSESGRHRFKGYHLCLWATSLEGLNNLWAIVSAAELDAEGFANVHWEHMEGRGKGIIASTACLGGAVSTAAIHQDPKMFLYFTDRLNNLFDDVYIELHVFNAQKQHEVNLQLAKWAKDYNYPVIYAMDSHYVNKEDATLHDMWMGLQTKSHFDEDHWKYAPDFYIYSGEEVRERLSYLGESTVQECFVNAGRFCESVQSYDLDTTHKIPKFPLPDGWTNSKSYFVYSVLEGLYRKVGKVKVLPREEGDPVVYVRYEGDLVCDLTPYFEQLRNEEFPLIVDNDFSDYFLIVSDYTRYAKKHMLVGPARGSIAASICAYCLDITEINPYGKGLYFSRFLNEGRRNKMPDADIDYADADKHLVHEYLVEKYGRDRVCAVGTSSYFKTKSALKDVFRYYRVPIGTANRITSIIGQLEKVDDKDPFAWKTRLDKLNEQDRKILEEFMARYGILFDKAESIVGLIRQQGKHAAGYVISPESLIGSLPVRKTDEIISQFDKNEVEDLGYLKADVLGLRNLTTLSIAAGFVKKRTGVDIDFYTLEESDENDRVWELLANGDTLGLFQISKGQTALCKTIKPKSIMDICLITAAYRPGVIDAGLLDVLIRRVKGEEPVVYDHPLLEPILKETFGILLYQENLIQVFMDIGGFTPTESDMLREGVGKKRIKQINALKPKFYQGAQTNGVPETVCDLIWKSVEASGNYLFNKGHSYSYATLVFWTAYMKAYYPLEWYAACMSTVDDIDVSDYIIEARKRGVRILPPSVVAPSAEYTIDNNNDITFGLTSIKGIGPKTLDKIIQNAPYESFDDFRERSKANKAVIASLIKVDFFREFEPNRKALLQRFSEEEVDGACYSRSEICSIEEEALGIALSVDPFDEAREVLGDMYQHVEKLDDVEKAYVGSNHVFLGILTNVKQHTCSNGLMAFLSYKLDDGSPLECTCFSTTYSLIGDRLKVGEFMLISVKKEEYRGQASFILEKAKTIASLKAGK